MRDCSTAEASSNGEHICGALYVAHSNLSLDLFVKNVA